jgi:diguanylate cyclase (GGDEF)-like protein/PAS domain S-box-containing protein
VGRKGVAMETEELNLLQEHITILKECNTSILKAWLSDERVKDILALHHIDFKLFYDKYATGVLQYFIAVIEQKEELGSCPTMIELLDFFYRQEITVAQLFTICIAFRESVISKFFEKNVMSDPLHLAIGHLFDANLTGALAHYSTTLAKVQKKTSTLQNIIDKSVNEVYIVDPHTLHCTYANDGALANIGYTQEELFEISFFDLQPNPRSMQQLVNELAEEESVLFETRHQRKNGSLYPVELRIEKVLTESGMVLVVFASDISKRVHAIEEKNTLQTIHKELQSAQKVIQDYLKIFDEYVISTSTDLMGSITNVSQAYCDLSGYSKEELLGKKLNVLRHGDMPHSLYKNLWDTIQAGKKWHGEIKNKHKNGDFFWVKVHIAPQFENNKIIGYTAINENITSKKKLEEYSRFIDAIIDATSLYMVIVNAQGKIVHTNKAWREFIRQNGYKNDSDLIGYDYFQSASINPQDTQSCKIQYKPDILHVLSGEQEEFITDFSCEGIEKELWMRLRANHFTVCKEHYAIILYEDITNIKQNEQQLEEQQRALKKLNHFYKALDNSNRVLIEAKSEQELFDRIAQTIHDEWHFQLVWIGTVSQDKEKTVYPVSYAGEENDYTQQLEVKYDDSPLGKGPCGCSIRDKRTIVVSNTQTDKTFDPWKDLARRNNFHSCAAFPIIRDEKVFGILTVYSNKTDAITNDEVYLLEKLTSNLALGLDLIRRTQEFETIFKTSRDGVAIVDLQTNFLLFNKAYLEMTGFSKEELLSKSCAGTSLPKDKPRVLKAVAKAIKKGYVENFEKTCTVKSGEQVVVNMAIALMPDKQRLLISTKDVTASRIKEQQLRRFVSLIDEHIITASIDIQGKITDISKAFCRTNGYAKKELLGNIHENLRSDSYEASFFTQIWETLEHNKPWHGEFKNRKKDGGFFWVNATISPLFSISGEKIGYITIEEDITDKKYIRELSITDELTQLYNRRHFNEVSEKFLNISKRNEQHVCFLMLDIDFFKHYNDTYGHQQGDKALSLVAACLKKAMRRANDYAFRMGGEEFALLFNTNDKAEAKRLSKKIRSEIAALQIKHKGNKSGILSVSMGLVCKKACNVNDIELLYKEADDLLYEAKEKGRDKIETS